MNKHATALLAAALALPGAAQAQGYVNAFAGAAVFDATVTVGGAKLVDQGGDAAMGGLRIGYGNRWPSGLYLGAEIEGFGASGRSRACVNGECYTYALHGGAGGFIRAGWVPHSGSALFFARGGAQAMFTSQGTQIVPTVGIGAEVPFSARWFARVDITYAWSGVETYQGTAGIGVRW